MLYGAIIGDVIGSRYEIYSTKAKDFVLFPEKATFTDDSVMTIAVARALMRYRKEHGRLHQLMITEMQSLGRRFPHAGYGMNFREWLREAQPVPYYSYGNGSAMRASPCGLAAATLDEALLFAKVSAEVSHNHPEGIKGAQAVAAAVFLAKQGCGKVEILKCMNENFYPLSDYPCLDALRPTYRFSVSCQNSVPEAILAFLESNSFEEAIRNAVSLGGDADTQAAIAGSIAAAFYLRNGHHKDLDALTVKTRTYLPQDFIDTVTEFKQLFDI